MTNEELDAAIAATPGEKVTNATLDAAIVEHIFLNPLGTTLTVCVIKLRNGFTVTGESACVDPANYRREIGEKIAYDNARNKIWLLEGYALAERRRERADLLAGVAFPPDPDMYTCIGTKVVYAKPMTRGAYNTLRGWTLPADENGADAGYLVEYADEQRPNCEGFVGYVSWSPADVFERAYKQA